MNRLITAYCPMPDQQRAESYLVPIINSLTRHRGLGGKEEKRREDR
jgi:hypothetical protein